MTAKLPEQWFRSHQLSATTTDGGRLSACVSSETPCEVPNLGGVVLRHDESSISFERARARGLPVFIDHEHTVKSLAGRAENLRLDPDRKLRADFVFRSGFEGLSADIAAGFLTDVSVGVLPRKWEPREGGVTVTNWVPFEVSIVGIGKDPAAGFGRSIDDNDEGATMPADEKVTEVKGERAAQIRALFEPFDGAYEKLHVRALENDWDVSKTSGELLAAIGKDRATEPAGQASKQNDHISLVRGAGDQVLEGARLALEERAGLLSKEERKGLEGNPYRGLSISELARAYLRSEHPSMANLGAPQLIETALRSGEGYMLRALDPGNPNLLVADFPALLENIISKRAIMGWEEAEKTWMTWTIPDQLPDFKPGSRLNLSHFTDLPLVPEDTDYADGIVNDKKEPAQLATYGLKFSISRQAFINDDLGEFGRVGTKMAEAAARTVNTLAYGVLTSNPTMNEDGVALFHTATHGNLDATPTPLDKTTLNTALVAMKRQVDSNSIPLNITGRYVIVPPELMVTATELITASFDISAQAATTPNVVGRGLTVVVDAALTDVNDWYVAAASNTVHVFGLNGAPSPDLEREVGWTRDAFHWKIRIDVGASAVDWRGLYKAVG